VSVYFHPLRVTCAKKFHSTVELQANVQPITRSLIRIDLTITPDFVWEEKYHGNSETFWIIAEDVDGEVILFHDQFLLRQRYARDDHFVTFTVPMQDPPPPNYFISIVSDRWLHAETRLPVSFKHLILPRKFPPPTTLLDLQPLPTSALHNPEFERIYTPSTDAKRSNPYGIETFNKVQTQVFQALYKTNDNVFVGAPAGSGKTICAEFALLRLWSQPEYSRCVCIEPFQEVVDLRVAEWQDKFGNLQGGKKVVALTGESVADLRLLNENDVVVCTPTQWDMLSRRWKQRKAVQDIGLFIADEVHMVGGSVGPTYEVIIARTRYVGEQAERKPRIVALGVSLANAEELGEWIGADKHNRFNFSPGARPLPLEVHLQSFNVPHFPSLMVQMAKPTYLAIVEWAQERPAIVFVPSRRQCKLSSNDLLSYALADEDPKRFLRVEDQELERHIQHVTDEDLRECLRSGIGFYHEGLSKQDKRIVEHLYRGNAIQVVVASKDTAWSIPLSAYLVILMGVQSYEGNFRKIRSSLRLVLTNIVGREHRYIDYPFADILQMMGKACRPSKDNDSRAVLMIPQV
jgi:pre-mRNA-splicing helicase BRR2